MEGSGEEEEEEDEDEESEDMSGNDMDVEGEMGMEKFERPRWCKVSGECGNGSLCLLGWLLHKSSISSTFSICLVPFLPPFS